MMAMRHAHRADEAGRRAAPNALPSAATAGRPCRCEVRPATSSRMLSPLRYNDSSSQDRHRCPVARPPPRACNMVEPPGSFTRAPCSVVGHAHAGALVADVRQDVPGTGATSGSTAATGGGGAGAGRALENGFPIPASFAPRFGRIRAAAHEHRHRHARPAIRVLCFTVWSFFPAAHHSPRLFVVCGAAAAMRGAARVDDRTGHDQRRGWMTHCLPGGEPRTRGRRAR